MSEETQTRDRKSLRVLKTGDAGWTELAKDCVCFANANGATLDIGIEDGANEPPPDQKIEPELLDRLRKRLGELTVNVQIAPELVRAENGGEYVALRILRSTGIASTVDGRYYIRVGDACNPVVGNEVMRLLTDRPQVPWEMMRAAGRPELKKARISALVRQLRTSGFAHHPSGAGRLERCGSKGRRVSKERSVGAGTGRQITDICLDICSVVRNECPLWAMYSYKTSWMSMSCVSVDWLDISCHRLLNGHDVRIGQASQDHEGNAVT